MFIFKVLCNMAVVHFLNLLLLLFLFPDFYSFFFSRLVNGTRLRAILTKGQPWFICRSGSYSQTAQFANNIGRTRCSSWEVHLRGLLLIPYCCLLNQHFLAFVSLTLKTCLKEERGYYSFPLVFVSANAIFLLMGLFPYMQVLPDLFHTVRTCDDALKDFITWKLGTLVSIVRQVHYIVNLVCVCVCGEL